MAPMKESFPENDEIHVAEHWHRDPRIKVVIVDNHIVEAWDCRDENVVHWSGRDDG